MVSAGLATPPVWYARRERDVPDVPYTGGDVPAVSDTMHGVPTVGRAGLLGLLRSVPIHGVHTVGVAPHDFP
jgi:hypothetical protein